MWAALGIIGGLGMTAIGDMVSEEVRDRLDHLPHAILRLAARRLDPGLREDVYDDEWMPELNYILKGDEARPITRLYDGTRFALGILAAARRIARGLACSPELALEAQLAIAEGLSEMTTIRDAFAFIDDRLGLAEAALASDTFASDTVISESAKALLTEVVSDFRLQTDDLLSYSARAIQRLRDANEWLKEPGRRVSSTEVEGLRSAYDQLRRAKERIGQRFTEALATLAVSAIRSASPLEQPKD
jgi:hypothetical protein